jgi:hypothetical protein
VTGAVLCAGFFLVRPTAAGVAIINATLEDTVEFVDDQKALNFAVLNHGGLDFGGRKLEYSNSDVIVDVTNGSQARHVTIGLLPYRQFPRGIAVTHKDKSDNWRSRRAAGSSRKLFYNLETESEWLLKSSEKEHPSYDPIVSAASSNQSFYPRYKDVHNLASSSRALENANPAAMDTTTTISATDDRNIPGKGGINISGGATHEGATAQINNNPLMTEWRMLSSRACIWHRLTAKSGKSKLYFMQRDGVLLVPEKWWDRSADNMSVAEVRRFLYG